MFKSILPPLFAACMLASGMVRAQPAEDTGEGMRPQPQQRTPPATQPAQSAGKPAASFTPSERISADSAVSFPVDI